MARREFIRAATLAASGVLILRPHAWLARASSAVNNHKRLVLVFLRGAVDGLNVVVPYDDGNYYENRPSIALPRTGERAVLNLDGYFGLNPALDSLMPAWKEGTLAFVHACGSPDPTRSHFDAQDYIESGTPGIRTTPDGWMNRTLTALPGPHQPTEALSLGAVLPRILSGSSPVANIPLGRGAARPMPLDNPRIERVFDQLYEGYDPLSKAYQEGRLARQKLLGELTQDMAEADKGAPGPEGFPNDAARLAWLIQRDSSVRLAFISLGGWDTHVNQGSISGQLANHLKPLGDGLADFVKKLGPAYDDTVILVVSEFGRTVRENGNGGTDHGHGNVMWVMGGPVRGRRVYGQWSGLSPGDLYQERDLAVTTDFREPIVQILHSHLGLPAMQIQKIFPKRPADTGYVSKLIKG
ncbi:MAG: DUF1501 domain-containing protein [Deltaproteobacteria bacterium]|nr:DUF1501 domain-containing protein [Deltaproteobacteria bacterium]